LSHVALAAMLLALAAGGFAYYKSEERRIGREAYAEIHAIAALKADEIELWRAERRFDASKLEGNPFLADAVAAFLEAPLDETQVSRLRTVLRLETRGSIYTDALLIGNDGRIRLSVRDRPDPVSKELKAAIDEAVARRSPVLADLYRCPRGVVYSDVVAPVLRGDGSPIAAIALHADVDALLFSLVQSWPTPSPSAETLLVRREGDEVVFLNELRHRKNTPLALRYPLTRTEVPAVQAVLGKRGQFRGADYRGVEVIADMLPIEGSDWFMVAKVDADEVLSEARYRGGMVALFVALAVLLAAATARVGRRRREAGHFRNLYAAERRLREAEEELRTAFYSIGDAVITTDREGRVRQMNPVAARLTGWNEAEARGRPLADVFHIVHEETRAAAEDPVARVLREGQIVGLANHTVLIARDGIQRPIADSGAPIRDESDAITGVVLVFRDQTDERAAQAALRTAQERQRAILSAVPDIVMEVDDRRIYTWANGPGKEFFGDDVFGKEAAVYFVGEQNVYEQVLPLFEGAEQVVYLESWQRRRDGEKRLLAWWCRVLKDEQGNVTGALSTARDITDQKIAEEALRESETRFRGVFESSTTGKSLTAPNGRLLRVNPAFALMLGRSMEEMQRANFAELTHPDDLAESLECVRCLVANERSSYRMEKRYRHLDGHFVWTDVGTTLLRDSAGAPLYFVTSINDITERKQVEEALRASEEKYRVLVENAEEAIFVAQGGMLRFANSNTKKMLGYPAEELSTRPFADFIHPDDRALVMDRHVRRSRGEELPSRYVLRIFNWAGDTIWMELNVVVIVWDGAPATLNFATDITYRKREEARRGELEEQLRSAQKMEAIGGLAGGIAHDFNNLLSVILSFADFALAGVPKDDPVRDDLLEVKKAGERAAMLTRQLLAFGRRQILQPAPLDLNRVVAEFEKMLRRTIGEDIDFEQILAPDLGLVHADPGQIGQVLMNLVINAREAMPEGGKLTIETADVELDGEYAATHADVKPGPYVLLAVTDSGCGMEAETRERIFEPFFTTKSGKGTGLGLSTVHGIVKQSGGDVWVYSEPGIGTTFKVYLPRLIEHATFTPPSRGPEAPAAGTETVLVVEDEEAVRNLVVRILRGAGYAVLPASNGAEALDVCGAHPGEIHLVLTDVVMPDMNGKALADRLAEARPGIRVLYMSGYTDDAIVHHGALDQETSFIAKPFNAADLARKVREVLDGE
jgi:PAS domain S-box-containing protein